MKRILIVGATSAIAEATARLWAAEGHNLFLAGRDAERLAAMAVDLRVRGAGRVGLACLDLTDRSRHDALLDEAEATLGGLDISLIAHGTLSDQAKCEVDFETALREIDVNALSVLSLLTRLAPRMEARKAGSIAVIGSVAGDRGRASNYVYGTAKGAVDIFLQGLRQRLVRSDVHVLTIKPGFVDTPMTRDFPKGPLWAQPAQIARGIVRAVETRRNVVYLPGFWRLIMSIIRLLPTSIFNKLPL